MLDNSSSVFLENSSSGGGGGGGDDGDRNSGGNRWPQEETLALLKIRSDMDHSFRDSILKAPLWDEVSRKLGELGYNRSAKKCKEKFENIYKYHKRTKEGRSGRHDGKSYRFFEQLEHLDTQFPVPSTLLNQIPSYAIEPTATTTSNPSLEMGKLPIRDFAVPPCSNQEDHHNPGDAFMSAVSTSTASSSGKESEGSVKKKRKLEDYFEMLMKGVLEKQEDFQNKFLEALEKCEKDRIAREEAWKAQEMARIKKEQEFLAQERAMAAAKDAAVLAFLQKFTQDDIRMQIPEFFAPSFDKQENVHLKNANSRENGGVGETSAMRTDKQDNSGGDNTGQRTSSSRWPKAEVEALIMLKTDLDNKYHDSGPKGPLWEEVASCMKKLGYYRSAKRCKEKWENINKYYKRVKESKRKRPEDSKTCPYFNLLESLYAKKLKGSEQTSDNGSNLKPEQILMQMMGQHQQQQPLQSMGDHSCNDHPNQEEDDLEDEPDDDSGDGYRVVANNLPSTLE